MNAYLVDAGDVEVCQERLGELGSIYGVERVINIVFAETRAKAKYQFWQQELSEEGALTEFTYRTRLLRKSITPPTRGVDALRLVRELWDEVAAAEEKQYAQLDH